MIRPLIAAARSENGTDQVPWVFVTILAGTVGLFVLLIVFVKWREAKRSRALESVAKGMGFSFTRPHDLTVLAQLTSFSLMTRGHSKKLTNIAGGVAEDTELKIFDYRYTIGGGKSSSTHMQTVMFMRREAWRLPTFHLYPTSFFGRLGERLGMHDCNLDGYDDFNKMFTLKGPSELAIRQFFTPALIEFLQGHPELSVEAHDTDVIIYRTNHRIPPEKIPDFFDTGWALRTAMTATDAADTRSNPA